MVSHPGIASFDIGKGLCNYQSATFMCQRVLYSLVHSFFMCVFVCVFSRVFYPSPFYPASLCVCTDMHFSSSYIYIIFFGLWCCSLSLETSLRVRLRGIQRQRGRQTAKQGICETGDSPSCCRRTSPAYTCTYTHVQDTARMEDSHITIGGTKRG